MNEGNASITEPQLFELIRLVKRVHAFDFSQYSKASLKRRVSRIMMLNKMDFYDLRHHLTNEPATFQQFLEEVTVNVTEMFRDPDFYNALQTDVIPQMANWPALRVWSAGCSSGEEIYSLAILLNRHDPAQKPSFYGTDINARMLDEARKGVYSLRKIKSYADNFALCNLPGKLLDHFTVNYDTAVIHQALKQNTKFSIHNLVSDDAFNEFQLISCRNVFIYFESELQSRILNMFYESMSPLGFLCLGSKESIRFPEFRDKFKVINPGQNIYQKIGE